jgi:putative transposase
MLSLEPLGEHAVGSNKGKRLGTSSGDLVTSIGRLEDLKVPRDREGPFHTQTFERDRSSEPHIARSA